MDGLTQRENPSQTTDFNDVFGGPPRRFSGQESVRSSLGKTEEEASLLQRRSLKEMPVFGEETSPRRRHVGNDFFDDIFGGDESFSSPSRSNCDRDSLFARSPSRKINSPSRLSPLHPDNFGPSLPLLSLPAKLGRARELSSPKLSRFSDSAFSGHKEGTVEDDVPLYRDEPLSVKYRYSSFPEQKGNSENLKKETGNVEHHFHFSFYNWAGKGAPMLTPVLLPLNGFKSRETSKQGSSEFSRQELRTHEVATKLQDFYQQVLDKVHDLKSMEGPDVSEEMVKSSSVNMEVRKPANSEAKSLLDLLNVRDGGEKEDSEVLTGDAHDGENVKETEGMTPSVQVNDTKLDECKAKGKVREFVDTFSQMTDSRNKKEVKRRSQSYNRDAVYSRLRRNKSSIKAPKERRKFNLEADHKPDDSVKYEEKEKDSPIKFATHTSEKNATPSEMLQQDSNISPEFDDDISEFNFVVEVLSDDPEIIAQPGNHDTKAIDAKIQQWSAGKKGNIHSLLSTLQFVLWPGSGWKPVPLVDLIEGNSVKRAYQKALLHLHPDKLQQRNAASDQKYIAEKVFDILQEAWDHFNSTAPLG